MPIIGQISVGDGATFTPSVSSAGELSWTNNKNLPNPEPVDIAQAVVDAGSLDSRYLQLSGGTVTGNLTVDGTLTGTASGNLPLSGGTMTGRIWFDSSEGDISLTASQNETGRLRLMGGSGYNKGAQLLLSGKSHSSTAGQFQLGTNDGTNAPSLIGKPDGTLTWNGNTIPTKNVNIQVGKTASTSVPAGSSVSIPITFSPAFSSVPIVIATVQTGYDKFYATVGSLTTSSASIKVNNASGTDRSVTTGWVAISI